ncbi:MAG: sigma-70 family RNA polymerase sigma factor [Myxococcales bacterium]|nr:sigma-70 family RNA polymerase sigma factor [Myxococcales bacterium]MBK7191655.1 sigma-70 family RNA polymerase sigma factor [Myxococcales bacterium]MBP6844477.1 sigma-70 family RNA polymerase sigma factor [Kofleriaceae bacterium]
MAPASEHAAAYQRFGPALVRKAERILRNREDAVDVVQALFTELIARGAAPVDLPYLYRAVTNRALNVVRDARGRARLLERQQAALAPAPRASGALVVGLDLLARLCDRLDDDHRDVLVARYVDELTQDEIAALYGVSRKTVGKRLARVDAAAAALAAEGA